ncbi:MAG: flagellar hook-length control protein FliK [Rhodospirillales bacterium]|nr:flagellar hook-length control protein FliK [Rhodospirillales bacterium]
MFLQPLPASALREATPQSWSAVAGSAVDDARRGQFAALLTDTLARSRVPTPRAHEPAERAQQASEPQERWTDAETRARTRDHEPELSESSAREADEPAADEEGPIVTPAATLPLQQEGVIAAALPLVPTPPAAPLLKSAPEADVPAGMPAPAAPAAANGTSELTAGAPASAAQDSRLAGETDAAQPFRGAAVRTARGSQTGMVAEPATPELAAAGRLDGKQTAEAANFTRSVMAAAGTPVRLSVVSDQAPGVGLAGNQSVATASAQGPANGPAGHGPAGHGAAQLGAEALGSTVSAAQAGSASQEQALTPSLTQPTRTDAAVLGAPAALVTAATAADLAAGGNETGSFAFRDGNISGRFGVTGRVGERAGIALRSTPDQVAVHITRAAQSGTNRIEISLDPESLGHVEVKLEVGRDGRVSALVLTENREALDALKAETRALQQALQDAGLKADADSLSFQMQGEHGRRSTGQMFVPEGADVRSSSNRAEEGALKDTLRSAEPHRPVSPRGQLDVVA